jgi:hypothetical protein
MNRCYNCAGRRDAKKKMPRDAKKKMPSHSEYYLARKEQSNFFGAP